MFGAVLSAHVSAPIPCALPPSCHLLQYLHQEASYNSILVWKDDKDPLGVRIPGT